MSTMPMSADGTTSIDESGSVPQVVPQAVPPAVSIGGEEWPIRRAWPASRNRIAFEAAKDGGIRAGFLGEGGVEMHRPGRDPKLPGLELLLAKHGENPSPDTNPNSATDAPYEESSLPQLISHRPGKRAVIRLPDGSFAKCVRPGRAAGIIAGQDRAEAFRPEFALPQVLWADDSTVVLSVLPGVELHDPHRLGDDWSLAWSRALDAWALASPSLGASTPVHGPESEVGVLEEWRERARDLLARADSLAPTGSLLAWVDALIAEIGADLLDGGTLVPDGGTSDREAGTVNLDGGTASAGERNVGPIHRDLHDKQIMWDPIAGPGLLDVDTACRGERELDLGNLRAHARWRTRQGIWNEHHAEAVIREISRVTSAAGLDPERTRVYERAALVRLACVYAFRPQWRSHTPWLLATAQDL